MTEKKFSIPEVSDEFLQRYEKKIQPLKEKDGVLWHITHPAGLHNAFLWDAKYVNEARGILELVKIRTLHTWAYYGFFKPSVAEVLAQIPGLWLEQVDYFSVKGPEDAEDLNRHSEELNAGFHVAETTLYRKASKSPFIVYDQPKVVYEQR